MGINEARGGKVPAPRPIRAQVAHKTNAAADLRFRLLPKSALQIPLKRIGLPKGPLVYFAERPLLAATGSTPQATHKDSARPLLDAS